MLYNLTLFLFEVLQYIPVLIITFSSLFHLVDLSFEFIGWVTLIKFIIFMKHFLLYHVVLEALNNSGFHVRGEVHLSRNRLDINVFLSEQLCFFLWSLSLLQPLIALVWTEQAHIS